MKKIILALTMCFLAMPAMAFENYLLMSDHQISKIKISNPCVLEVEPIVVSKDCKKHTLMLVPKQVGSTKLTFCKGKKRIRMTVKVYCDKTCIKRVNGIHFVPLDVPVELR